MIAEANTEVEKLLQKRCIMEKKMTHSSEKDLNKFGVFSVVLSECVSHLRFGGNLMRRIFFKNSSSFPEREEYIIKMNL